MDVVEAMAGVAPDVVVGDKVLFGQIDPAFWRTETYGSLEKVIGMGAFALVFGEDRLFLWEVNEIAGLTGDYAVLTHADILSVKVKAGLLLYRLSMEVAGEKSVLVLEIYKRLPGESVQKENLGGAIENDWYGIR